MKRIFVLTGCAAVSLSRCFADFDWTPFENEFASKPCKSYCHYLKDGKDVSPSWSEFKPLDFGSRQITFETSGARPFNQIPPPGVHPRVYFTAEDLPEIRRRLKETRCGQEVWKNILSWTEMMKGNYDDQASYAQPDIYKGSFGLHGRVPLFRLNVPSKSGLERYNHNSNAAAIWNGLVDGTAKDFPPYYWGALSTEAFRCLVENDEEGGKKAASAVVTAMKIDQAKRDAKAASDKILATATGKPYSDIPDEPVGKYHLGFCYDFLYNWMSDSQKTAIHDEIARSTWIHDNYGTFNDAEASRSNWATFSYWLYEVLAIEGEPGFNPLKVRGIYRGWRNLLSYGWFTSGATFEGEAKNQLGMDGVFLFTMRQKAYGFDNLCGHPYLRAYADKFLPHSTNSGPRCFKWVRGLGGRR
jgi:hypothetical protein